AAGAVGVDDVPPLGQVAGEADGGRVAGPGRDGGGRRRLDAGEGPADDVGVVDLGEAGGGVQGEPGGPAGRGGGAGDDDAHRPAVEPHGGGGGVFGVDLVGLVAGHAGDLRGRAEEPGQQVDVVQGLVHQHPAAGGLRPPRGGRVVGGLAPPVDGDLTEDGPAQLAGVEQ